MKVWIVSECYECGGKAWAFSSEEKVEEYRSKDARWCLSVVESEVDAELRAWDPPTRPKDGR